MSATGSKSLIIIGGISVIALALSLIYFSSNDVEAGAPQIEVATADPANITQQPIVDDVKKTTLESEPKVIDTAETKENQLDVNTASSKPESNEAPENTVPPALPVISFVEGEDYITKFPNEQPKNPVLVEFFSYMCPHCFNFEPTLTRWIKQKPASVELLKVPVTFGRTGQWKLAAKSYYIAQELKIEEQFSKAMFRKIHIEKNPPRNDNDLGMIFESLGINNDAFKKAATSFNVNSNLRKADFLTKKYKVTGVPYFLINKKYETGKDSYTSEQTLFRLWNHLPAKDF